MPFYLCREFYKLFPAGTWLYVLVAGIQSAFSVSGAAAGPASGFIRFTHVLTNIGGHYNTTTGVFTCQYSGLYAFTLNIMKQRGRDYASCFIRKNGSDIFTAWIDPDSNSDGGWNSATNSVVLHLVHGDIVDVVGGSPIANIHTNTDTSSFSGFLIKAD